MLRSVHMTEVTLRVDDVTDSLFEFFWAGKTTIAFAFPYDRAVHGDLEQTAGRGDEADFADIGSEGLQDFLRHPAGPKQPVALRAIADGYAGFGLGHPQVSFIARRQ